MSCRRGCNAGERVDEADGCLGGTEQEHALRERDKVMFEEFACRYTVGRVM